MVQRITSIIMLSALCFAGIGALLPRSSKAQTLRDELEKGGMIPAMVNQNARANDNNARDISELKRRADYLDNLHVETRIAMLEKFVSTSEENQKLLWGMLVTLVFFVMKEIYVAFFKSRAKESFIKTP